LAAAGAGVFEVAPAGVLGEDLDAPEAEMRWMRRVAEETGQPVTFALLQHDLAPTAWQEMLSLCTAAADEGIPLRPQVAGRPLGLLMGLQTFHPLSGRRAFQEVAASADGDLASLVAQLRRADVRAAILADRGGGGAGAGGMDFIGLGLDRTFSLGEPPEYEPAASASVASRAERDGVSAWELLYDLLLESEGRALLMRPLLGYSDFTQDPIREMLLNPTSALGLGDGGAHCGAICDASTTTYMLTHWARDRSRGERLPLEWVVRKMTRDTATLYGLCDRGQLTPGMKADVNVIDFDRLTLRMPQLVFDLPAGARRLTQRAEGYRATIVSGQVVLRDGQDTGARPGQLVRGARPSP
jgi:N-acyl-D-aspartate/D-glutamate deacylase